MAFDAGAIVSKLKLDKTGWDASVTKVKGDESKLKGFTTRNSASFKKMGMAMTAAGGAIVASLGLAIKKFVETGDWIDKMSKRTGMSATALSELAHAADISGASLNDVEKSTKKMAKSIVLAGEGLESYNRAFELIGISVKDLQDLNPEEQFVLIGDAIGALEDPTLQAAAAQEIFGRSGTTLIPLFKEGKEGMNALRKEAHELGIVFDEETATKAANLKDEQTRLAGSIKGLSFMLAETLIPVVTKVTTKITEIIKGVQDWAREHPALFSLITKVAGAVGGLMLALGPLLMVLPGIASGITLMGSAAGTAAGLMGPLTLAIGGAYAAYKGLLWIRSKVRGDATAEQIAISDEIGKWNELKKAVGGFTDFLNLAAEREIITQERKIELWEKYRRAGGDALQQLIESEDGKDLILLLNELEAAHTGAGTAAGEHGEEEEELGEKAETAGQKIAKIELDPWTQKLIALSKAVGDGTLSWTDYIAQMHELEEQQKVIQAGFDETELAIEDTEIQIEGTGATLKGVFDSIGLQVAGVNAKIVEKTKEATTKVKSSWEKMADGLQTKWASTISDAIIPESWKLHGALGELFNAVLEQFGDMIGQMVSKWLTGFITKFVSSTKGAVDTVVGTVKDVATAATDLAKGFSPMGAIATGIGAAVGTFLGGLLGPKGAGERDMQLVRDYTWEAKEHLKNLVGNADAQKWALWNIEPRLEDMKLTLWSLWDVIGKLPNLLEVGHNFLREIILEIKGIGRLVNEMVGILSKVTGFASEGIAWEPQLAMVAETGPEAILDLDRLQAGQVPGQGPKIVFNIQTWDAEDTERWIRNQGLALIEESLRQNVGGATEKIEEHLQVYRKG